MCKFHWPGTSSIVALCVPRLGLWFCKANTKTSSLLWNEIGLQTSINVVATKKFCSTLYFLRTEQIKKIRNLHIKSTFISSLSVGRLERKLNFAYKTNSSRSSFPLFRNHFPSSSTASRKSICRRRFRHVGLWWNITNGYSPKKKEKKNRKKRILLKNEKPSYNFMIKKINLTSLVRHTYHTHGVHRLCLLYFLLSPELPARWTCAVSFCRLRKINSFWTFSMAKPISARWSWNTNITGVKLIPSRLLLTEFEIFKKLTRRT